MTSTDPFQSQPFCDSVGVECDDISMFNKNYYS